MEEALKVRLEDGGINVNAALDRFMGNEAMFVRYLQKFTNEQSYLLLKNSISSDDRETARREAHTLKGICGTLGCEKMQKLVITLEQHIRDNNWTDAVNLMPEVSRNYESLCTLIMREFSIK